MGTRAQSASILLVLALAACGGGTGSKSVPIDTPTGSPKATSAVRFSFAVGGSTTSNKARRPDYISRNTNGIGIRWRPSGGSFTGTVATPGAGNVAADVSLGSANCVTTASPARTCTVTVPATVGNDDFEITLWDSAPVGGTFGGNQLSNVVLFSQLILQNQVNALSFTLNGVVTSVALSLTTTSLVSGTPGTTTLNVLAKDASGNIIVAPGTYVDASGNPVTITVSATPACSLGAPTCTSPGTTTLGVSSFTGPSVTSTTVTYNGGPLTSSDFAVTAPSLAGNTGTTLTFTNTDGSISIPGAPAITEYSSGISASSTPYGIASGPDGNLWFTEQTGNRIARITPSGTVTEFSTGITGAVEPIGIASGADGNLWFTEHSANRIGRITPSGTVTEFSSGITGQAPARITSGPDGNMWYVYDNGNYIGRITPSGAITEFPTGISGIFGGRDVTSGPDGNLWFTYNAGIGRMTPSGAVTTFTTGVTPGSQPSEITSGHDGNLWFTEYSGNRIGRITTSGTVTEFSSGISGNPQPVGITSGRDGNLWFTEPGTNKIARITTSGKVTEFSAGVSPGWITLGPDGNLWFTDDSGNKIGKLVP